MSAHTAGDINLHKYVSLILLLGVRYNTIRDDTWSADIWGGVRDQYFTLHNIIFYHITVRP